MNVILSGTAWSVGGELSINPVFNWIWLLWLVPLLFYAALFTLIVLGIRALLKYLRAGKGDPAVRRSLGEALKAHRMKSNMTQEFVAERLGVSRQAVSKWETGASEPSTTNLLALAKLYGVSAGELLRDVE